MLAEGELQAARELERRITQRAAESFVEIPGGWEARHPGLPDVYHLNLVMLAAPLPAGCDDAAGLVRLVEERQHDLGHRRVVLDDAQAGERLSGELQDAGWERDRVLWMALRSDPADALADPRARLLSEGEIDAARRATMGEDDYGPDTAPGIVERLLEAARRQRAGTTALSFGSGESRGESRGEGVDGHVVAASHCTLFCEEDLHGRRVAIIDNVATLRAHRRQGLSKAALSAAIRAAGEWGADLIALPADADDWPQVFYAGLGFEPIGRQVGFTRRGR